MEFKSIKITTVPGVTVEVTVDKNASLEAALAVYTEQTGTVVSGYDIRMNGADAAMTIIPADGTRIYLVQKVKGRA